MFLVILWIFLLLIPYCCRNCVIRLPKSSIFLKFYISSYYYCCWNRVIKFPKSSIFLKFHISSYYYFSQCRNVNMLRFWSFIVAKKYSLLLSGLKICPLLRRDMTIYQAPKNVKFPDLRLLSYQSLLRSLPPQHLVRILILNVDCCVACLCP